MNDPHRDRTRSAAPPPDTPRPCLLMPALEERHRPFAVGILALPPGLDTASRAAERLAVSIAAYRWGYFLLDTLELDADPHRPSPGPSLDSAPDVQASGWGTGGLVETARLGPDAGTAAAWARVWALAAGTEADIFIVRGPVPREPVEAFALELRISICHADGLVVGVRAPTRDGAGSDGAG